MYLYLERLLDKSLASGRERYDFMIFNENDRGLSFPDSIHVLNQPLFSFLFRFLSFLPFPFHPFRWHALSRPEVVGESVQKKPKSHPRIIYVTFYYNVYIKIRIRMLIAGKEWKNDKKQKNEKKKTKRGTILYWLTNDKRSASRWIKTQHLLCNNTIKGCACVRVYTWFHIFFFPSLFYSRHVYTCTRYVTLYIHTHTLQIDRR